MKSPPYTPFCFPPFPNSRGGWWSGFSLRVWVLVIATGPISRVGAEPTNTALASSTAISNQVPARAASSGTNAPELGKSAPSVAATVLDYETFRLIADRNVFNASRTSRSARTGERPVRRAQVETVSLVGAMSSPKGDVAFFDGSSSQYRKALKVGESIVGYQVVAISADAVQLEAGDKKISFKLGAQLRREEQGPWELSGGTSAGETPRNLASSSTNAGPAEVVETPESASPDTGATGEVSDALKRLMQKREQELKNENP